MSWFTRKPKELQSGEKLAYVVVDASGKVEYMSDGIDNCYSVLRNSQPGLAIKCIAYRPLSKTAVGPDRKWVDT